jgi:SAM-dependent MidA family methyltransferase
MGSSNSPTSAHVSEVFARAFRARAGPSNTLDFAQFMTLALYDPVLGYYAKPIARVGYGQKTDFYTASTSGQIFGELIAAACVGLLNGADPREFEFVEIGAETAGGVFTGVNHPFGSARTVRLGAIRKLTGRCVIFSNELFDAQPFRRLVFRRGAWRELGVELRGAHLDYVELVTAAPAWFPAEATEGYVIDAPFAATDLLVSIIKEPWTGLFVACDYGKSWAELATSTPGGTARAYFRHTQSNALLANAGQQDLTCHLCWDWLVDQLNSGGFTNPNVKSQESFLIRHAGEFISSLVTAEAPRLSQRKLAVMHLLHPSHLGQKFQVLHASRA